MINHGVKPDEKLLPNERLLRAEALTILAVLLSRLSLRVMGGSFGRTRRVIARRCFELCQDLPLLWLRCYYSPILGHTIESCRPISMAITLSSRVRDCVALNTEPSMLSRGWRGLWPVSQLGTRLCRAQFEEVAEMNIDVQTIADS